MTLLILEIRSIRRFQAILKKGTLEPGTAKPVTTKLVTAKPVSSKLGCAKPVSVFSGYQKDCLKWPTGQSKPNPVMELTGFALPSFVVTGLAVPGSKLPFFSIARNMTKKSKFSRLKISRFSRTKFA